MSTKRFRSATPAEIPDWRLDHAARIGAVGEKPVPKGLIVVTVTQVRMKDEGMIVFPVVSAVRLWLSMAIREAGRAAQMRKQLVFEPKKAGQKYRTVGAAMIPTLYDYFECAMSAATSSYYAIE